MGAAKERGGGGREEIEGGWVWGGVGSRFMLMVGGGVVGRRAVGL